LDSIHPFVGPRESNHSGFPDGHFLLLAIVHGQTTIVRAC
jgi:hypothetical protein